MSPYFIHPVPLLLWTAGIGTTVAFFMLGASNWASYIQLRRREFFDYAAFTLMGAAQALTIVLAFLPMSEALKAQVFRLMWVFGGGTLFYWVRSLLAFTQRRSLALERISRGFVGIALVPLLDGLLAATTGHSFFYALEPRSDASIALLASGNVFSHRPLADALALLISLVVLLTSGLLLRELWAVRPRDRALLTGVMLTPTFLVTEVVLIACLPNQAVPLLFMANLVEGIRITKGARQRLFEQAFAVREARQQQTALVEGHLKNLAINERLARLGARTAELSHDLRNPLTTVAAGLDVVDEFLQDDPLPRAQIRESLGDIRLAVSHVLSLVQRITSQGRQSSEPMRELSVQSLVQDALSLCKARLVGVSVKVEVSDSAFLVGRRTELSQVLVNLLTNASDAIESTPDPWIRILAESEGETVRLLVMDSGHRPPDEVVAQMFQPNFSTNRSAASTGLGLAICAEIVGRHAGQIRVDRSRQNTTFVLTLPRRPPSKMHAA